MEKTILVGGAVSVGSATSPVTVPNGAIAVFNADTGALVSAGNTIANVKSIFLVRGVAGGEQPVISPTIDVRSIVKWEGKAYQAPARHVMTLGFVGSGSNAIGVTNNAEYSLIVKELSSNFEPFPTLVKSFTSDATATGWEIADAFARLINADQASRCFAEVLINGASTALANAATITTYNGSPLVVVSDAADAPAVGAYLRIGGTALTFPVYRVLAVSGANVTLDRPYWAPAQALGAVTAAVAASALNAAPTNSTEAGLRLTAKEFGFVLSVSLDDAFVGTPVVATTAFVNGFGTAKQVQAREKQLQGNQGKYNNVWLVQPTLEQTDMSKTYDAYQIAFKNNFESSAAPTDVETSIHEVVIFMDSAASTQKTALKGILNPLLASTPIAFPNVTV